MAEDPFCPFEKNSSASRTSVLCKCLISVANLSSDPAMMDKDRFRFDLGKVEESYQEVYNLICKED